MRKFAVWATAIVAALSGSVSAQTFNPYGPGDTSNDSPYQGSTKQQDERQLQRLQQHDLEEQERASRAFHEQLERERQRREAERQEREEEQRERAASGADGNGGVTIAPGGGGVMVPSRRAGSTTNPGGGSSTSTPRHAGAATPSSPARTGGAAGGNCTNMTSMVTLTTARPTGPGHCASEITGHLTNHSSERVWCVFAFYNHGVKTKDGGGGDIAPGQTTGGEMAGIWSCGADTIRYACFPAAPDPYSCHVNW